MNITVIPFNDIRNNIEILIFEIVLMRAPREKHFSCSKYQPGLVYQTLAAGGALER